MLAQQARAPLHTDASRRQRTGVSTAMLMPGKSSMPVLQSQMC